MAEGLAQMVATLIGRQVNITATVAVQLNPQRPSQLKNPRLSLCRYRRQFHALFRLAATLAPVGELIQLPRAVKRTTVAASFPSLAFVETSM